MASKTELLNALVSTKQIDGRGRSPEWIAAFDAFNSAPENKNHRVTMSCGACWNQVKNWLRS